MADPTNQAFFNAPIRLDGLGPPSATYHGWTPFGTTDHADALAAQFEARYLIPPSTPLVQESVLFGVPSLSSGHQSLLTGEMLDPITWGEAMSVPDATINYVWFRALFNVQTPTLDYYVHHFVRRRATGDEINSDLVTLRTTGFSSVIDPVADPTEAGWLTSDGGSATTIAPGPYLLNPFTGLPWDTLDMFSGYEWGVAAEDHHLSAPFFPFLPERMHWDWASLGISVFFTQALPDRHYRNLSAGTHLVQAYRNFGNGALAWRNID